MLRKLVPGLMLLLMGAIGCSERSPVAPDSATSSSLATRGASAAPGPGAGRYSGSAIQLEGETGPGALYRISVPEGWNGDLILYAHGYIDPPLPVALPTLDNLDELTRRFLALGYAIAYSSYSENGYALKDAALRTHQLRGIFASKVAEPRRVYLAGHSLGGIVVEMLAERFPESYAGALPMSGVLGGTKLEVDYIANVRVLFDHFYGGDVLPGNVEGIPAGTDPIQDVALPAIAAIQSNPQGAFLISQIDQTRIAFQSPEELVGSIVQALVFHAIELDDLTGRTHGHPFFDNQSTVYTGALPQPVLDDVNARVERYQSTPDAQAILRNYYEPSGDLQIPMLALHTCRDPLIPAFHVDAYAARVKHPELFARRLFDRYGHSNYQPEEVVAGLLDLVTWVETGEKPAELLCSQPVP
ncbi:MAG TPA: hypothetical protein VFX19_09010 [Dehalococcoidia bacterium]|nr:hypothetical protein [Dehalococcoidia bacterium]